MMNEQKLNDRLLFLLQNGLPLCPRPFAEIGKQLRLSESQVLAKIGIFNRRNLIRRFGGVFDAGSLGYKSTLCAIDAKQDDLEWLTELLIPNEGITHCYLRSESPSLWFTITSQERKLDSELNKLAVALVPYRLCEFPAVHRFKIKAVFDDSESTIVSQTGQGEHLDGSTYSLSNQEKSLVRVLQEDLPLQASFYADVAKQTGYELDELLGILSTWQGQGILRRIGAIVYHYKMGYLGNAMCVWVCAEDQVAAAGEKLAAVPEVSHCYERQRRDEFPYNLYAMIHMKDPKSARTLFQQLSSDLELENGRMLASVKEYKKTSPRFFSEEP